MRKLAAAILICDITITSSIFLIPNNYKLQKKDPNFSFKTPKSKQELFVKAINNNTSLNNFQKEELTKLKDYLTENPYINQNHASYLLENFKIRTISKDELSEIGASAYYDSRNNTVYVDKENYGIYHECLHMLTDYCLSLKELSSISKMEGQSFFAFYNNRANKMFCTGLWDAEREIGRGLNEGMTALLAHEYFGEMKCVYNYEQTLLKMLCEIIEPSKVLEAYSNANIDIIINELTQVDGNENQAIDFVKEIDAIYYLNGASEDDNPYEEIQIHVTKAIEILDKYHKAKNGVSLNENKTLFTYKVAMDGMYGFYVVKGYFSNTYKEQIGDPYILYDTEIIKCDELDNPIIVKK